MSEQIAVRPPEDVVERLNELISSGRFGSKAEAVRAAIGSMLEAERRRELGDRIAEGYRRVPQTDEEVAAATEAAVRSIHEEPW